MVRRRRNKVKMLKNEERVCVEDAERLKDMAVSFYSELFRSKGAGGEEFISGSFLSLDAEYVAAMEREYTVEDTLKALRKMGSYKALGPDGYQVVFFKSTWKLTGAAVHSFVKGILEGGAIPTRATDVLLVLYLRK